VQPSLLGPAGQLAARLVAIAPEGLGRVTFTNSGAEAIEAAIKLCRAATGRLGILSTHRGLHGKTLGALSATGNADLPEVEVAVRPEDRDRNPRQGRDQTEDE
jgi:4-aminobutyrate aminotransferase-like enzyme